MCGFRGRWKRLWAVMLHKQTIVNTWSSFANVLPLFHRTFKATFKILAVASDADLQEELQWAIGRPKSKARGMSLDEVLASPDPWALAQTPKEDEFEESYMNKPGITDDHAIQLNQNAAAGRGMHSPDTTFLHTVIRNSGLIKIRSLKRWLVGKELLLYQGFPVLPELATPRSKTLRKCCSFCPPVGLPGPADAQARAPAAVKAMAGNSMNLSIPNAITIYLMVFTDRYDMACTSCKLLKKQSSASSSADQRANSVLIPSCGSGG